MGYYSTFYYLLEDVTVDENRIKQLESYFSNDKLNENVYGFCDVTF